MSAWSWAWQSHLIEIKNEGSNTFSDSRHYKCENIENSGMICKRENDIDKIF